jgi:hypothetical protein
MEQLEGTIEQVVYYNSENGYSVFKLQTETGKLPWSASSAAVSR